METRQIPLLRGKEFFPEEPNATENLFEKHQILDYVKSEISKPLKRQRFDHYVAPLYVSADVPRENASQPHFFSAILMEVIHRKPSNMPFEPLTEKEKKSLRLEPGGLGNKEHLKFAQEILEKERKKKKAHKEKSRQKRELEEKKKELERKIQEMKEQTSCEGNAPTVSDLPNLTPKLESGKRKLEEDSSVTTEIKRAKKAETEEHSLKHIESSTSLEKADSEINQVPLTISVSTPAPSPSASITPSQPAKRNVKIEEKTPQSSPVVSISSPVEPSKEEIKRYLQESAMDPKTATIFISGIKDLIQLKFADFANWGNPFIETITPERAIELNIPNYTSTIAKPIGLDEIENSLQQQKYERVSQLIEDLQLVVTNAKTFNMKGDPVYTMAEILDQHIQEMLQNCALRGLGFKPKPKKGKSKSKSRRKVG